MPNCGAWPKPCAPEAYEGGCTVKASPASKRSPKQAVHPPSYRPKRTGINPRSFFLRSSTVATFIVAISSGGGGGGIRTLDTPLKRYNTLAGCRFQPLSHSSKREFYQKKFGRHLRFFLIVILHTGAECRCYTLAPDVLNAGRRLRWQRVERGRLLSRGSWR